MKLTNNNPEKREYILVHEGKITGQLVLPPQDWSQPDPPGGADLAVEYFRGQPGIIYFALGKQADRYKKWRKKK